MQAPRIELKKLKIHDDMSEETLCYSAEVWVDGKPAFLASNHGTGGGDLFDALPGKSRRDSDPVIERCEAYAKTLPRKKSPLFPDGLEMDLELLIGDLIEVEREKKDRAKFFRQLQDRIFILRDGGLYSSKPKAVQPGAAFLQWVDRAAVHYQAKHPAATIITLHTDPEVAWAKVKPHLIG